MQKITTFLTFNDQAEEAATFYTSIFADSKINRINRIGANSSSSEGRVLSATFQLRGQEFFALNGGPSFTFSDGISLFVDCDNQQEVDELWERLSEGGKKGQCGWLKDKFGVSWQIVPSALGRLLQGDDPTKSKRVMEAMMQMTKIDIQTLEAARNG
ncbi:VOC family protein [Fibrella sp. HMF5335]|uniref:VOC family protein n=1 Tax=Fibrella rubiginis TaxID=2817060 RepID=A0A939GJB3_9BACT|nr:VOC family protein [Fibrella rubiginis]MBO0937487.1 VOC family protein [Fibrella rubiginis]